jgi:hypothetical protein
MVLYSMCKNNNPKEEDEMMETIRIRFSEKEKAIKQLEEEQEERESIINSRIALNELGIEIY